MNQENDLISYNYSFMYANGLKFSVTNCFEESEDSKWLVLKDIDGVITSVCMQGVLIKQKSICEVYKNGIYKSNIKNS